MSQKDTSYVHIVSTLCLRTTLKKYNTGGYASGTDIVMPLSQFVIDCLHLWFLKGRGNYRIHQRSMD